jgi:transketolase
MESIDELCINTIRFLAIDSVEKAKSGHPGMPLGAAPMAYVVWNRHLRHNPTNPKWFNRDRFILSAGHGSALLYSLLHLYGYNLELDELKRFRRWGSKTPGHPEYGRTPGVEATTGPLGQGIGMAVGIALAEKFLSKFYNQESFDIIEHYTYTIVSDGDLMEGISSEAASIAGNLKLGKLIVLYDDNHISIEGHTDIAFTENLEKRFKSYDWQVFYINDGNDIETIDSAINRSKMEKEKPTLIIIRTHIGYGSPLQDNAGVYGKPLGEEMLKKTKKNLGWPPEMNFYIPSEALNHFREAVPKGEKLEDDWKKLKENYSKKYPELAFKLEMIINGELPENWDSNIPTFKEENGPLATMKASGKIMNRLADNLINLIGGSADLAHSENTVLIGYGDFGFDKEFPRNIHFGVREHAMGAIVNGMALHGGLIPYGATFLVFSDYMRPALRLASLMNIKSIFIFTHDSVGLGEDGPTHQPVEQLMSLRVIPNITVIRPADANETAMAWRLIIERKGPVALILSRQNLSILNIQKYNIFRGVSRGGYVMVYEEEPPPDIILIATGSEVHLALESEKSLREGNIKVRIVSMPSIEIFNEQSIEYREKVLLSDIPKMIIEAGVPSGWYKYIGGKVDVLGLSRFGASAPGDETLRNLGFNVSEVVKKVKELLKR